MAEEAPPLQAAADRIRETAKWLTVSLGALGTVLVAGSQLSGLGSLEPSSDRFTVAVVGAIVAGVGAAIILAATALIAATPAVALDTLDVDSPKGVNKVLTDPSLLQGHGNVADLRQAYDDSLDKRETAMTAHYDDPDNAGLKTAARVADANAVRLQAIAMGLVGAASYANLAYRWRRAALAVGVGALLAAAGVGCFAWATNPPEDAVASSAAASVLTAPKPKVLKLNATGVSELTEALGTTCPASEPIAVLLLANTAAGPDVVVDESKCTRIRMVVTSTWGVVSDG